MTFGAEDVTLVAARSVEEGLALARQIQPELVIADGMMPGRSGYDLCAAIKSDPALGSTAVYVLASAQQPYDESRGRQCGADGFFVKPFDTAQIIEKVHEALAKGPTEVDAVPRRRRHRRLFRRFRAADPARRALADPARSRHAAGVGQRRRRVRRDQRRHLAGRARRAARRSARSSTPPRPPPPAARPSLTPPPTYVPAPGATPAPRRFPPARRPRLSDVRLGGLVPDVRLMRRRLRSDIRLGGLALAHARFGGLASADRREHAAFLDPGDSSRRGCPGPAGCRAGAAGWRAGGRRAHEPPARAGRAHADGITGGERADPRQLPPGGAAHGAPVARSRRC